METMNVNDLENMDIVEPEKKKIDVMKYVGIESVIVDAKVSEESINQYGKPSKYIEFSSAEIGKLDNGNPLYARKRCFLNKDPKGKWGFGEKSPLAQMFEQAKTRNYKELIGKKIKIIPRQDTHDAKIFYIDFTLV